MLGAAHTRAEAAIALRLCALACLLLPLWTTDLAAESIFSQSRKFRIPFQYDMEELERLGATEIQLFVSQDQGETWQQRETVAPHAEKFTFTAAEEGEYWFSVRTIATGGLSYPAGPHQPELRVILDLTPPRLEVNVEEADPGRVRLTWSAADEHLDLSTLKLEFREGDTGQWQAVNIRPEKQGQTAWTASQPGRIEVRGSVADLAGNESAAKAATLISPPADSPDDRDDATGEMAVPDAPPEEPSEPSDPPAGDADPASSGTAESAAEDQSVSGDRAASPSQQPEGPPMVNPAPSKPLPQPVRRDDTSPSESGHQSAPQQTDPPMTSVSGETDHGQGETGEARSPSKLPQREDIPAKEPHRPGPPPANVRLVNSDTFHIGYKVEDVGPSGVGRVDLYITENGGQRWFHYGHDPDRTSPFRVKVPRDGEYGFSFRIMNGVGLVAIPPQPGDAPDITIVVDRVPPEAQLFPIRQVDAPQGTIRLRLEWNASDRQLAERPISLYHASRRTGPWERITERLPDTGRFEWEVPPEVDQKVYIRLEVRDAAGNVTRVDADEPFIIDRSKPRAQITDVEPLQAN